MDYVIKVRLLALIIHEFRKMTYFPLRLADRILLFHFL